jgi:formylglycine-generating enzyme required for sulfatase activity
VIHPKRCKKVNAMKTCLRSAILAASIVLFALPCEVRSQATLAPSVQTDLLRDKIYAQAKTNDAEGVLVSLEQYHKLTDANNLAFPVPLLWLEAKAAHDSGDAQRALSALTGFLNRADHNSAEYKQGLALYPEYAQSAHVTSAQQSDAKQQVLRGRIREVAADFRSDVREVPGGVLQVPGASAQPSRSPAEPKRPMLELVELPLSGEAFERPSRQVTVNGFRVMKGWVTHLAWDVFAADTGANSYDDWAASPAHYFSARMKPSELTQFVEWVSEKSGHRWRLLSEAEVEWIAELEVDPKTQPLLAQDLWDHYGDTEPVRNIYRTPAEIVADCWHRRFEQAPSDSSAWIRACETDARVVLEMGTRDVGLKPGDTYEAIRFERVPYDDWTLAGETGQIRVVNGPMLRFRLARDD